MIFAILFLTTIAIGFFWLFAYFQVKYRFWKNIKVPYLEPSFPLGNLQGRFNVGHVAYLLNILYERSKGLGDYVGTYFFSTPVLFVTNPEFAKTILVRDFAYFSDRGLYNNRKIDPLSANLFFVDGSEWKYLRNKFSPTFSSGKIKAMFQIIERVSDEMVKFVDVTLLSGETELNVQDILARFTTDVIGRCGFGVECNSISNPTDTFREIGKKIYHFTNFKYFKYTLCLFCKKLGAFLKVTVVDSDVEVYLQELVKSSIKYRRENNVRTSDFMQLMIDVHKDDLSNESINDIAAQAMVFYFAGFETSSLTMIYCMYELALNQDIQNRLRNEIQDKFVASGGKLTYECVNEMTYLDQVVCEVLRIYNPVCVINRCSNRDYKLPNGSMLPAGIPVMIPSSAFHHDPEFFPNPNLFDPERFNEDNKSKIRPCTYLPFGEGNRNCVGMRFGLIQSKMGIASMVRNFKFSICKQTRIPLQINPISLVFAPEKDIYLRVERVNF